LPHVHTPLFLFFEEQPDGQTPVETQHPLMSGQTPPQS
jgi:hypothetical protein